MHLLEDECLVRRAGELAQHHGLRCYDAAHLAAAERIRVGATVMGAGDENPCTSPETLGPAVADTSGKGGAGQPQRPVSPPIRGGSGYLLAQHLTAEVLGSGKTETLRLGLDG